MDAPTIIRNLRIIHIALLMGVLMFTGVALFVFAPDTGGTTNPEAFTYFMISAAVMLAGIIGGQLLYRMGMQQARATEDISRKTAKYQAYSILRWALLEGPVLVSVVCYMVFESQWALAVTGLGIALMAFHYPSLSKLRYDTALNETL